MDKIYVEMNLKEVHSEWVSIPSDFHFPDSIVDCNTFTETFMNIAENVTFNFSTTLTIKKFTKLIWIIV